MNATTDPCGGQRKPCAGCPWVVGHETRSHVEVERHERASSAFSGEQGFHTVMACHTMPTDTEGICLGYLNSVHAFDNFAVRMLATAIDFDELSFPEPMYETYDAMRAALEGTS